MFFLKLRIVEHTGHRIPMIVDKYGKEALETNIHSSLKNIMKK